MTEPMSSSMYFISASQETSSRSRLFRPKELRDFVFPGVGMIMHSLFWVKHSAHLHQRGINPAAQNQLLLYATTEEREPLYDEGLLRYILASRLDPESSTKLTAGVRTVKNWLFEPQYDYDGDIYDRVVEELRRMASQGESYDEGRFVEDIFAPWFVTRCSDLGIDLGERLRTDVLVVPESEGRETRSMRLLSAFCELIGSLVYEHDSLRGTGDLNVIGSTIHFATQLFIPENDAEVAVLADPSFHFTPAHTAALLRAVANLEHGHHFVRSMFFVIHIGPLKHSGTEFDREMRRIHDIVNTDSTRVLEIGSKIAELDDLPPKVVHDLDETSYYWLLNFFMADGETIARTLLNTDDPILGREEVIEYFEEERERARTFSDFIARPEDGLEYLPRLLDQIHSDESPRVYHFLDQLRTNLEQGTDPPQVLLDLLETNGTIEPETEQKDSYRIREFPTNTGDASFYGIGPLRDWAETLLKANE